MDQTFNTLPVVSGLLQAVPVWALIWFFGQLWMKKIERHDRELQAKLDLLLSRVELVQKTADHLEKRNDAIDVAVSAIIKDSFSSAMIAKGTGSWPRIFRSGPMTEKNSG